MRGHNLYDIFYGRYREQEQELLEALLNFRKLPVKASTQRFDLRLALKLGRKILDQRSHPSSTSIRLSSTTIRCRTSATMFLFSPYSSGSGVLPLSVVE